jgi:AcrR family transcriptional regulator
MSGTETRLRILETSRKLFNDYGTQAISTNHIAREMGISPGNLYYHFKNKQMIIRTLIMKMFENAKDLWYTEQSPSINNFLRLVHATWVILWEYRFFQREQIALLERDAELKDWYQEISIQRQNELIKFFEQLVQSDILREPEDPTTLTSLVTTCWIVGEYWQSFLYITGQPVTIETIRGGLRLIYQAIRPHLTEHTLRQIPSLEQVLNELDLVNTELIPKNTEQHQTMEGEQK